MVVYPLIPALRRQALLCEFKANLIIEQVLEQALKLQRNTVSKQMNKQTNKQK